MTDLRTAAQQALEAIRIFREWEMGQDYHSNRETVLARAFAAEETLEAALAEPVQEPVAWYFEARHIDSAWAAAVSLKYPGPGGKYVRKVTRLYATPQRRPLTEDEIRQVGASYTKETWIDEGWSIDFARAIEQAHGIGTERPATLTKPCGSLGEDVSLCRYPDCSGGQAGTICNNWCPGARK